MEFMIYPDMQNKVRNSLIA